MKAALPTCAACWCSPAAATGSSKSAANEVNAAIIDFLRGL